MKKTQLPNVNKIALYKTLNFQLNHRIGNILMNLFD